MSSYRIVKQGDFEKPEQRPECPWCGRRLKQYYTATWSRDKNVEGYNNVQTKTYIAGEYEGYGAFCRLSCAENWANQVHKFRPVFFNVEKH